MKKYVQAPTSYLSGSGVVIGATTITVNSFQDIYGNTLTMSDFGDVGYCTVEPDTGNKESFTFSSITTNTNGTVTLGGIKSSLAKSPYTQASGLVRAHVGGSKVVVTDTAAFWDTFANKNNDEIITGLYTFTQSPLGINPGGSPDASTTVMGIARSSASPSRTLGTATITIASPAVVSFASHGLTVNDRVQFTTTGALPTGLSTATTYYVISSGLTAGTFQVSASQGGTAVNTSGTQSGTHTLIKTTPVYVSDTDYRLNTYAADTGAANAYVVTLPFAPTAYVAGQTFSFKATNANTTASTVNFNGLGAKTIKKLGGSADLASGDIAAGMIVEVEYDGTNFVMLNPVANPALSPTGDGSGLTNLPAPSTNCGVFSQDISVTTTTNITHGLGRTPKYFRITGIASTSATLIMSHGAYNGTNSGWTSRWYDTNGAQTGTRSGTGSSIYMACSNSGAAAGTNYIVGTVTWNSTTITITWGGPGGNLSLTANYEWEAF